MMLGLVLPLIIYAARAVFVLTDPYVPFDTEYTYLPFARRLLEDAASLWNSPDALQTAPGVYVYMALANADIPTIKSWNLVLALTTVALLFDAARRTAGPVAAAAAAWLCALSPTLLSLSVWLMAEPPFLFLVALWLWACACSLDPGAGKLARKLTPVIAGLALAMATLTRATYMYWIPATIVVLCAVACVPRWRNTLPWRGLLLAHLLALACVGSYIALNQYKFGKPAVATGAGAALYFGSNPMLSGQEPPHFGLMHDNVTVTGFINHLSIEADTKLTGATRKLFKVLPASAIASMYLDKAATLLFFSKSHLRNYSERIWRVVLVVLAICGAWLGRRRPMIWLLLGAMFYQWIVLVPVLYNPRYSVSALDTILILLATAGIGWLWQSPRRKLLIPGIVTMIVVGALAGAWHQRYSSALLPQTDTIEPLPLQTAQPSEISVQGFTSDPFQEPAAAPATGEFSITWQSQFPERDGNTLVRLGVHGMQGECKRAWITSTSDQGQERATLIRLHGWRGTPDFSWGLNQVLTPSPSRKLQIRFECTAGTRIHFSGLGLYDASIGRWLGRQALTHAQ